MLGFMIPPSIAFVIYSVLTEVSIGTLFMAGILPGILIAILFMAAIYVVCRLNPSLGPVGPKATWRERFSVLYRVWGILVLFFLVLGGMYGGVFTPTEAGAVGAFGALVLGLSKRRLSWQGFNSALSQTVRLTGMIFMLIIGATIFNYFLALTEIPFSMARLVGELPVSPVFILTALLIMYIILGFIMDIMAVMILSVPIVYPILLALDINPVWFGVLVVLTIMMGNVTPPVGIVVYTVGGLVKDVPLFTIFRGVVPFLLAMLIGMGILIAFPQISLFLPNLMKPG
jgi:tripartite ATP-independent transporter DctM subunit